jgi:hypothetical protein
MAIRVPADPHDPQTGGITILVALMLLVLLTVAALGMSKNAVRDIVSTGFTRQAAMTRSVAESGVEWTIYWMDWQNAPTGTNSAAALSKVQTLLLQNDAMAGVSTDIITGAQPYVPGGTLQPDLQWLSPTGTVEGFTIGLTRMGKLPLSGMSQGVGSGAYAPATGQTVVQAPDLWAVRADAQVVQGPATFIHAQEAWISTPVQ